jgi:benzylsuccinate CoA-transferase BbsF subunit
MQALERYRIIDMGNVLAGPMVSQFMADMGAQVIKVETTTRLDGTRQGRPIVGEDIAGGDRGLWPELQPLFHCLNRNKLGITVNIREPRGLALVRELVSISDVVINNNSPGVMDRLGLGYPVLRAIRPDIIMVSMPGAGESGPLKEVLAYASITSALSGLMGLIGYPAGAGDPEGTLAGQTQGPWCDVIASLNTLIALLAALRHRNLTGEGQYIEVAQLEASVSLLGEAIMEYGMTGRSVGLLGTHHNLIAPNNNYPCQGEDRWVSICIRTQEEWEAFSQAIGNPPWTSEDGKFADAYSRSQRLEELDQQVAGWTRQHTPEEVTDILQNAGVAAMPVMNIEDQFTNPHYQERGVFMELEHPRVGTEWIPGAPWQLSETPGEVRRHAPLLGEHNLYVLQELLGYGSHEYQALEESGALA